MKENDNTTMFGGYKKLDMDEVKQTIGMYRKFMSKEKVELIVRKWVAYYSEDRQKIIDYVKTT